MIQSVTEREIATYNQRGYVVPDIQLSAERIGELDAAVHRLIANNPDVRPERLVSVAMLAEFTSTFASTAPIRSSVLCAKYVATP